MWFNLLLSYWLLKTQNKPLNCCVFVLGVVIPVRLIVYKNRLTILIWHKDMWNSDQITKKSLVFRNTFTDQYFLNNITFN